MPTKPKIDTAAPAAPAADAAPTAPPTVLQLSDAKAMSQGDRIALFKEKDAGASKLCIELAKLLVAIRADMKDPSKATPLLKKSGIRPGTVNEASNNARVFTMLVPNLLSEAAFDTFTLAQMRSINKVSAGGVRRLTPEQIAEFIAKQPEDFGEEFESIFLSGMTITEAEKEQRDLLARKEKQEKEAKEKEAAEAKKREADAAAAIAQAKADKEAAEAKAEETRIENERLKAEAEASAEAERQRIAAIPVGEVVPTPQVEPEAKPTPEPVAEVQIDAPPTAAPALVEGEHKTLADIAPVEPVAEQVEPGKVVAMIPPVEETATTGAKMIAAGQMIEHLERIVASLPDAERATVTTRMMDLAVKLAPATGRANVVSGKPGRGKQAA